MSSVADSGGGSCPGLDTLMTCNDIRVVDQRCFWVGNDVSMRG